MYWKYGSPIVNPQNPYFDGYIYHDDWLKWIICPSYFTSGGEIFSWIQLDLVMFHRRLLPRNWAPPTQRLAQAFPLAKEVVLAKSEKMWHPPGVFTRIKWWLKGSASWMSCAFSVDFMWFLEFAGSECCKHILSIHNTRFFTIASLWPFNTRWLRLKGLIQSLSAWNPWINPNSPSKKHQPPICDPFLLLAVTVPTGGAVAVATGLVAA